jgi:hypothetical protein
MIRRSRSGRAVDRLRSVAGLLVCARRLLSAAVAAATLSSCASVGATPPAAAAGSGPLVVGPSSHVVVMEYEAWFGPHAVTFQASAARPLLQSADMRAVGGGYDSADPAVIAQHVAWLDEMGIDAVTLDLTNDVSCIFDSLTFVRRHLEHFQGCGVLRGDYQQIRNNSGNIYRAWTKLGTQLKIIPLLGGIDGNVLIPDVDGKTAFEKEIDYFGALDATYPQRAVLYEGKPLMLVYLGAAQDPNPSDNPLWYRLRSFLARRTDLTSRYTFRMIAGYLDSQPGLWAQQGTPSGPIQIAPQYGFWSIVDRLNPSCRINFCPYYPTYTRAGSRVENFTGSIATAGQDGWGCPHPEAPPYCVDDALRTNRDGTYATFAAFMAYARALQPIFLIVDQFNEFGQPDEGWNAQTDDDIEPANLWGRSALDVTRAEVQRYKTSGLP